MIKQLAIAIALSGALAGSVVAQTASTPVDTPAAGVQTTGVPAPAAAEPQAASAGTGVVEVKETTTPDDCLQVATELAVNVDARNIADDKLEKIDDLLIKMETHCDARQFSEAHAVATSIKSLIETQ